MKKILLIVIIIISLFGLICAIGVYRYVSNVPEIAPRRSAFTIPEGTTVTPTDLADIKCNGEYEARFYLIDSNTEGYILSKDKSSLFVGYGEGTIHVRIYARGLRSEGRESDIIEISVVPSRLSHLNRSRSFPDRAFTS